MTTLKKNSRIIEEMQETFADLKKSGVISKKQMAEFDALKNLEVKAFQPKVIKQLRAKEHLSQAVFAAVLNISTSTIQKWETGEKKPSGPSLKLLSILKNKGIDITWGEKDGKILERIKEGMTDSEIKRMFKSIEIILNGLTVPEQNYYVNNTLNVETSEKITELNSEISDANKVIKETKEKFKQAAASSDNDKEFFKVGGKYYEKEHDDWEKNLTPLTKLSIENPTTKKIRRFFNDTKSLEILNSKNYDENDVFTYYGNDKKIWDILNGENFEDYSETPENIDRKLKTKP